MSDAPDRTCPNCGGFIPWEKRACPNCGHGASRAYLVWSLFFFILGLPLAVFSGCCLYNAAAQVGTSDATTWIPIELDLGVPALVVFVFLLVMWIRALKRRNL